MGLQKDIYSGLRSHIGSIIVILVTLGAVFAFPVSQWWARRKERRLFAVHTAMEDLNVLNKGNRRKKLSGTAVIIGGSVTGLITARICSDHFERVVIIEADEGADTSVPIASKRKDAHGNTTLVSRRPRVAQSFEIHLYRPFALLALRRLIPDFDRKFKEAGGRIKPWAYNTLWSGLKLGSPQSSYLGGRGLPLHHNLPKEELPSTIWMTRANLEIFLRKQILQLCPNITVINGTAMSLHEGVDGVIDRVYYSPKRGKGLKNQDASLVIDCTGHSKAGVKWMEHLGYNSIPEVSYDPQLRYVSVWFPLEDEQVEKMPIPYELTDMELYLFAFEDPALGNRLFWATRGEGNTIALGFGGFGVTSEELPRTAEELKDFYREMNTRTGKPMDEWYCEMIDFLSKNGGWEKAAYEECKIPPCVFVKYHEVSQLPSNFVALGDAVMRSSPVYGLGVTKGIVGAVTLAGVLDQVKGTRIPLGFGKKVLDAQNTRTEWHWTQAKEADYGYPTTIPCEGESLDIGASTREITKSFLELSAEDEEAGARFYYSRLWIYPNSVILSKRVIDICLARMQAKERKMTRNRLARQHSYPTA